VATQSVDGAERGRIEKLAVDVTALLAGVVARLRVPLLLVSVAPVLPGLAVEAIAIPTADSVAVVLGLLGLLPAVWLTVRRIQLGRALQPPEDAVADLRRTFSVTDIADQLKDNLLAIRGVPGSTRPSRLARRLWRGIRTGTDAWDRITDVPRLAPFLPGRLRGLALLILSCLVSAAALAGFAVLLVLENLYL